MAAKSVIQFVLGQFAKRSARKTGIPKILNANDSIVQSNALSIEKTLKNYGYDPSKMSSDDILKAMNYHKALMDQRMNFKFEAMGLSKGVDDLAKKPPFQGFKPTIVGKPVKGNSKQGTWWIGCLCHACNGYSIDNPYLVSMKEWREKGWAKFTTEKPLSCPGLIQCFTEPVELTGVVYEFIQRHRDAAGFCKDNVKDLMLSTEERK